MLSTCATVPLTGGKQISLIDESQMQQQAVQAYCEFLNTAATNVISNSGDAPLVNHVGGNIASAITWDMQQNGYGGTYSYADEFNLIDSKDVNAWCMSGGKVAVYTGILPVTQSEAGLAVVMGHEIAYALAGYSSEQASSGALVQLGSSVVGGVESLINHSAARTQASIPKDERESVGVADNLLRLSVGIKDI